MANKKLTVDLEVVDNLDVSIGNLKALKRQLKELEAGSDSFNIVKQKIYDMEDAIKSANTGAGNFVEIVGALPGPVGDLADKVSGAVNTLKLFGNIKLDALKNSFSELGKDIGDGVKGLGQLTGVTKVYNSTVNGLTTGLRALGVAEGAAAVGAQALAAATGAIVVTALIAGIMKLYEVTKEWITGEKAAKEAADAFNASLERQKNLYNDVKAAAARNRAETIAQLKADGATAGQIRSAENAAAKKDYEDAHKNFLAIQNNFNANKAKLNAEDYKKAKEARDAAYQEERNAFSKYKVTVLENNAARDKEIQDKKDKAEQTATQNAQKSAAERDAIRKQETAELLKGQEEAYLATLSEQEKEEYKVNEHYAGLIYLATKYGDDTTGLKKAQAAELAKVKDKYDKEELDKEKKKQDDLEKANKEAFDLQKSRLDLQKSQGLIDEDTYQAKLEEISIKYANNEIDRNKAIGDWYDYLNKKREDNAKNADDYAKKQLEIHNQLTQSWISLGDNISGTFGKLATLFEQGSDAAKTFGVISVIINAAATIAKINLDFSQGISDQKKIIAKASATVQEGVLLLADPFTAGIGAAKIAVGTSVGTTASGQLALLQASKIAQIAAVGITSGAQIATILSAKKSSTVSNASGGISAAGVGVAPAYAGGTPSMAAPQIQVQQQASPGQQIAQTLGAASNRPVRAFVVASDISNQQQLDRRTNRGATFSLG